MSTIEAPKAVTLTAELYEYLLTYGVPADPLLDELAERTKALIPGQAHMQVPRDEGALLTFLARLVGARNVVEVGTFTGASSLSLARGLAPGGGAGAPIGSPAHHRGRRTARRPWSVTGRRIAAAPVPERRQGSA